MSGLGGIGGGHKGRKQPIEGQRGKEQPSASQEEVAATEQVKKAKKIGKTIGAEVAAPIIIVKGGKKIDKPSLDAKKPVLESPQIKDPSDLQIRGKKINKKIVGMKDAEALERINTKSKENQDILKKATEEANRILQGNEPGRDLKAFTTIMIAIFKISKLCNENLSEFIKARHKQQREKQAEAQKVRDEQLKVQAKEDQAGTAEKVLGWVGAVLGTIASTALFVASIVLDVFTLGITTELSVAAGMLMVSSYIGLITKILDETGALEEIAQAVIAPILEGFGMEEEEAKAWSTAILGLVIAAVQIAIGIAAAVVSAGAGSGTLAQQIQQQVQSIQQYINKIKLVRATIGKVSQVTQILVNISKSAVDIVKGVYKYEIAMFEVEKLEAEKAAELIQFVMDMITRRIKKNAKSSEKLLEQAVKGVRAEIDSSAFIAGKI